MKRNVLKFTMVGCLLALTAAAGPLQRNDVPNDPAWVVHVDYDALKETALGKFVLAELEKPEAQKKLAAFQAIFNFDPLKAVHGATLFGLGPTPQDGVLVVYADFDAARLTTLAGGAKEHQTSQHGNHTIHSWIDQHKGDNTRTFAAIVGNRAVFGQKEARVKQALDVLDLTKPNLNSSTRYAKLGENPPASIIGAAHKIELPTSDANSEVFKHSKMFTFSLGEAQGRIEATVNLDTDSEEVAQQVQSVGQGMISLLALQKDKPKSAKLAQALSVKQAGAAVIARLSILAEDVVEMVKARAAKKTE